MISNIIRRSLREILIILLINAKHNMLIAAGSFYAGTAICAKMPRGSVP